ncbi:MAG: YIP1 family protein [Candidatus Levybacteria bacterium]|nr:YIP1 family protein [Candidatus Levybacteria bacterium]
MDKFINYLKEIIFFPKKAFKRLSQEKNLNSYFFYIVIYQIIFGFAYRFLYSELLRPQSPMLSLDPGYQKVLKTYDILFYTYTPITTIIFWFGITGLIYLIIKIFSKKGSFALFFVAQGLIGIIVGTTNLALQLLNMLISIPLLRVIDFGVSVWSIYLSVLAISIIFSISKKKSLLIILIVFAILITLLISSFIFLLTIV